MIFKERIFVYMARYSFGVRWLATTMLCIALSGIWWYGSFRSVLRRYYIVRQEYDVLLQKVSKVTDSEVSSCHSMPRVTSSSLITSALANGLIVEQCSSHEASDRKSMRVQAVVRGSFCSVVDFLQDSTTLNSWCWESGEWTVSTASDEVRVALTGFPV